MNLLIFHIKLNHRPYFEKRNAKSILHLLIFRKLVGKNLASTNWRCWFVVLPKKSFILYFIYYFIISFLLYTWFEWVRQILALGPLNAALW